MCVCYILFFWPSKAYISIFNLIHIIYLQIIMVDGATRRRLIRTTSCFASLFIALLLCPLAVSFFQSMYPPPQKKTKILYKSSPGFEPTTFLIRVNTKRVLTPKTMVPWLISFKFVCSLQSLQN